LRYLDQNTLVAPTGFTLNQILVEIENIFKFKDLVPMPADTVGKQRKSKYSPRVLESYLLGKAVTKSYIKALRSVGSGIII
jgi:hypothetical protein